MSTTRRLVRTGESFQTDAPLWGGLRRAGLFKEDHKDQVLVSVLTVVYNGASCLKRTIESVLSQDHPNVEYIVVDGGSTDGTLDVIKSYEDAIDLWISEKDKGLYDALNKGIQLARGKYITHVHADDYYSDATSITRIMAQVTDEPVVYGQVVRNVAGTEKVDGAEFNRDKELFSMKVPHPAFFVRRDVYLDIDPYSMEYRLAADYDMVLRLAGRYPLKFVPERVSCMSTGGLSDRQVYQAYRESRIITIKHGLNPCQAWMFYFIKCFKSWLHTAIFR